MNALTLYRVANRLHRLNISLLPRLIQKVNFMLTRCVVPYACEIGEGSELAYGGIATVIHKDVKIGRYTTIGPNVTIGGGGRKGRVGRVAVIGHDVTIGSHAVILGGVVIGDHAVIGAHAVVTEDVPSMTTVAGIPAKPLGRVVSLLPREVEIS